MLHLENLPSNLVQIGLTVSAVAVLLFLLRRMLKKRYPPRMMCLVWAILALRLLIPVQLTLPDPPVQVAPRTTYLTQTDFTPAQLEQAGLPALDVDGGTVANRWVTQEQAQALTPLDMPSLISFDLGYVLSVVWGVGVLLVTVWQLYRYLAFYYVLEQSSHPAARNPLLAAFEEQKRSLGISRNIPLRVTRAADCPMLAGFLYPALYLPDEDLSTEDAAFIFRHELTHYKQRDLWLKLLLVAARAVHWFNPLVHHMARLAQEDIEMACDEAVVRGMDLSARRAYGQTILRSVEKQVKKRALVSCFTGDKEGLMRRLEGLFEKRIKKCGIVLVLGAALSVGALGCAFSVGTAQGNLTDAACVALAEQWMSGKYRDAEPWYELLNDDLAQKLYEQQTALGAQTGQTDGEPLWQIGTSSPSVSRFTVLPDAENQQAVIVTEWTASASPATRQAERIHFEKADGTWKVSQVEGNPYINDEPFVDTADSLEHFRLLYENDLGLPAPLPAGEASLEETIVTSLQLTGGKLETVRSWDETGDGSDDLTQMRYTFSDETPLDLTVAGGSVQDYTYDGGRNDRTAADLAQQYARAVTYKSVWPAYPVLSQEGQQHMADSQRALADSDDVWYTKYGGSSPTVADYVLAPGKDADTYVAVFQLYGGGMTDYRSAIAITAGEEQGRKVIRSMERCDDHLAFIQEKLSGQDAGYTMREKFDLYYNAGLPWPTIPEDAINFNGASLDTLTQVRAAAETVFSFFGEEVTHTEGDQVLMILESWFTSEVVSEEDTEAVVRLHFADDSPSVDVQMRKVGGYWLPVGVVGEGDLTETDAVYNRVISEPIGADAPQVPFFNRDVICVLNYNGLLLFDTQTGALQAGIDVQKIGLGDTQGDSAMIVRGNDACITIAAMNGPGYIYSLETSALSKLADPEEIEYTDMQIPDAKTLASLDLSGFADASQVQALQSKDGILAYVLPLDDLSKMQFQWYPAEETP